MRNKIYFQVCYYYRQANNNQQMTRQIKDDGKKADVVLNYKYFLNICLFYIWLCYRTPISEVSQHMVSCPGSYPGHLFFRSRNRIVDLTYLRVFYGGRMPSEADSLTHFVAASALK